ncbi:MAG TPA: hypothetical protein VJR46_09890 [Candidatus Dormibacteraeota bacterium]|nr:hypothetical protein [Candidatus Dormibacteraeota bacterium]
MTSRPRRAVAVGVVLVVAAIVTVVQFGRLGQESETSLPPDTSPSGVDVFYTREPGNPHGLIAYDWSGARRGSVKLPTWVEIARLQPAPNGSGFFLDPSTPGDYAAYFDRAGRTLFETDDRDFISQAWADDSAHVCVLSYRGLAIRLPGQPDRTAPAPVSTEYMVAACTLRTDTAILASSTDLEVVRLSTGKEQRGLSVGGPVLASTDATYVAVSSSGDRPVLVYKTSDFSKPVAQVDAGLQPLAFSGDDSLLLASQPGGEVKAIAWRSNKVAWTYDASAASIGLVVARPSAADFVLYLSTGPVLLRRDGKTGKFG